MIKNKRKYAQDNLMCVKYKESIKHLKKITKHFGKFPTIREWNFYAKQNELLNSESLKYMSDSTWQDLKDKI